MTSPLSSPVAANALADGLERLADVVHTPMPGTVAELELGPGRPLLRLNPNSPADERCAAMLDAINAIIFGPDTVRVGEVEYHRHLRLVR